MSCKHGHECGKEFDCGKFVDGKQICCKDKYKKSYNVAFSEHLKEVKTKFPNKNQLIKLRREKMRLEEQIHGIDNAPRPLFFNVLLVIAGIEISLLLYLEKSTKINIWTFLGILGGVVLFLGSICSFFLLTNGDKFKCRCMIARRDAINELILEYENKLKEQNNSHTEQARKSKNSKKKNKKK